MSYWTPEEKRQFINSIPADLRSALFSLLGEIDIKELRHGGPYRLRITHPETGIVVEKPFIGSREQVYRDVLSELMNKLEPYDDDESDG